MLNLDINHIAGSFVVETLPDRERVIVAPRGELDIATVQCVSDELDALVDVGFADLVLDLRGVTFMDAAGLHLAIAQAHRPDATVQLIDGPRAVARIVDLAGVRDELPFLSPFEAVRGRYQMPHSISVLAVQNDSRGGEILAALTKHLDVSAIRPDSAGVVQLWLPLDGSMAHDKILAALDVTAEDWREHIELR